MAGQVNQHHPMRGIHAGLARSVSGLASLLRNAGIGGERFLIKVNWFGPEYGYFTDARTLDLVLSALPAGEVTIIEGHSYGRNDGSKQIDWRDLEEVQAHWGWLREQEGAFLQSTGLADVLRRHQAGYINITDEVWAGRTVPSEIVAPAVEARYAPVANPELYSYVPEKLWDLQGSTLISLARIKIRTPNALADDPSLFSPLFSLSMKNLFGLVPDPFRFRWHGTKGQNLAQSIVDITKIYSALFNVIGFNEGLFHLLVNDPSGRHETNWGNYDILDDQGVAILGRDLIRLDTFTANLFFPLDWRRWPLFELAEDDFGQVDEGLLAIKPSGFEDVLALCKQRYGNSARVSTN